MAYDEDLKYLHNIEMALHLHNSRLQKHRFLDLEYDNYVHNFYTPGLKSRQEID